MRHCQTETSIRCVSLNETGAQSMDALRKAHPSRADMFSNIWHCHLSVCESRVGLGIVLHIQAVLMRLWPFLQGAAGPCSLNWINPLFLSNQPAALTPFQSIDLCRMHTQKHALRAHALIFIHRWHFKTVNPVDHSYSYSTLLLLILQ